MSIDEFIFAIVVVVVVDSSVFDVFRSPRQNVHTLIFADLSISLEKRNEICRKKL